jgi:hypothetical protein
MTARTAIIWLVIGTGIGMLGALFKIQHWPYSGELLTISTLLQIIALIVLAVKVGRYPGFKEFLDQ